jgi:wyosine [tRNA(Phe)-imidazoG37] synthetase (radical SAM superfamily)
MSPVLSVNSHDRDVAGLKYVYPVLSRRSGGLSIGINLNTNSACNWRCIYCQVPDLRLGSAPEVDLIQLNDELRYFLQQVLFGDFYDQFKVAVANRVIKDIAISGNGEPTSAKNFADAVKSIGDVATAFGVFPQSHFVLITNGSLVHKQQVQTGLNLLKQRGGEVWFKLDSATSTGRKRINHSAQTLAKCLDNLRIASQACPTKLQTCVFDDNGKGYIDSEKQAYLAVLSTIRKSTDVREVQLYTLARSSMQPEAERLKPLSAHLLDKLAEEIRALEFKVSVAY